MQRWRWLLHQWGLSRPSQLAALKLELLHASCRQVLAMLWDHDGH
jgi:hypothetical protein